MRRSYLDYAMSVIVARALPDARDGLKPVQRRVLFAMDDLGMRPNSAYKKSARLVGEVLGKYHPHGDSSVYEAMVRMAQDFSLRHPLVDGQGNFGSVDNDPPAAMRYTEARLSPIAMEMLVDIDKNTVDFVSNFDDSLQEPSVLPARIPNLLVNGAAGIAVGMATSIPPHNLGEICDAAAHLIDSPLAGNDDLMQFVKGPDFPTGAIILGTEGIRSAYATGRGKVVMRARVEEITNKLGKRQLVITEIPYQVNKAALVERIAELAKEKKITGVSEVRDESDRDGMRVVIDLKREAQVGRLLNNLYRHTPMQSTYYVNMVALVDGRPKTLDLREALTCYIEFRSDVITRRSQFDLDKARKRAHILEGLMIALDNMDEVIAIIRGSETVEAARDSLIERFALSLEQAQAILDMPLRRLAHLEREKIAEEYAALLETIAYLEDLLANPQKILRLIRDDLMQIKEKFANKRRTEIWEEEATQFSNEDLIPHAKMIVTLTTGGFIKRLPAATYKVQHRGGRGVMGMVTRDNDSVRHILVADTHDSILFFTDRGRVYSVKCYQIPEESSRTAKGTALVNVVPVDLRDEITALAAVPKFEPNTFLVMASRNGVVKKTPIEQFSSIRRSGVIAINLREEDHLVSARVVKGSGEVVLISQNGMANRFAVEELRTASRSSGGVRGLRLAGDKIVGMDPVVIDVYLLTVSDRGFGKLTRVDSIPVHKRGGKGLRVHRVGFETGKLSIATLVPPQGSLVLLSSSGNVVVIPMEQISVQSRNARGVHLMALEEGETVVSVTATGIAEIASA
ncbi:MAG: DNA gyrase subunit A [Dehalococcoidia bacterium]|nr:DNA gyrase subunit A [Dehalococcoidia bacterium]